MMARSTTLQSKAGYIDARPFTTSSTNPLATHGRTIHARPDHTSGSKRRFDDVRLGSAPTLEVDIHREPAKVPKWRFARASITSGRPTNRHSVSHSASGGVPNGPTAWLEFAVAGLPLFGQSGRQ